jgi:hypothetical protein
LRDVGSAAPAPQATLVPKPERFEPGQERPGSLSRECEE